MTLDQEDAKLLAKLKKHPKLFARMSALVDVVENAGGDLKKAAEAEMRVIEEVRKMGHEALHSWANGQVEKAVENLDGQEGIWKSGKKNSIGTVPSE